MPSCGFAVRSSLLRQTRGSTHGAWDEARLQQSRGSRAAARLGRARRGASTPRQPTLIVTPVDLVSGNRQICTGRGRPTQPRVAAAEIMTLGHRLLQIRRARPMSTSPDEQNPTEPILGCSGIRDGGCRGYSWLLWPRSSKRHSVRGTFRLPSRSVWPSFDKPPKH